MTIWRKAARGSHAPVKMRARGGVTHARQGAFVNDHICVVPRGKAPCRGVFEQLIAKPPMQAHVNHTKDPTTAMSGVSGWSRGTARCAAHPKGVQTASLYAASRRRSRSEGVLCSSLKSVRKATYNIAANITQVPDSE